MQSQNNTQFHSWETVLALVGRDIGRCCRPATLDALIADVSRNHDGVLVLAWIAQGLRDVQRARAVGDE